MARPTFRRAPRLENLESRELLSTTAPSGGPTSQEQYMLQVLNLVRTNPKAAVQYLQSNVNADISATLNYYGVNLQQTLQQIGSMSPQPPLAWNQDLANAAQGHSQDMETKGFQSHNGSDGSTPLQRITSAGYTNSTHSGENVYAYSDSVDYAMEAFLLDWGVPDGGHRTNIMEPGTSQQNAYKDVGIGIVNSSGPNGIGPMVVTQEFGIQSGEKAQVVGVAYNDAAGTGLYQVGEGAANVQITAVNLANGKVSSTQTWSSGGYEMTLDPGNYLIIASQNNKVISSQSININNVNVEADFNTGAAWKNTSLSDAIAAAQPQAQTTAKTTAMHAAVVSIPTASQKPVSAPAPAASAIDWNWTVSTAKKASV